MVLTVHCFEVIKLPFGAFKIAFEKYPDAYLRVVQIVMIRLQRVGLQEELIIAIPSHTNPTRLGLLQSISRMSLWRTIVSQQAMLKVAP